MYRGYTSSWLKHWDFILSDFVLFQLSFFVSTLIRNGFANAYGRTIYIDVAILIGLLEFVMAFFAESYTGILRRGYWKEFKAVLKHVALVFAATIVYLFVMKNSSEMSRLVMGTFPIVSVVFLYMGRIFRKRVLRKRPMDENEKRAILLMCSVKNYENVVNTFLDNPYSIFKVVAIGLVDDYSKDIYHYREIRVLHDEEDVLNYIRLSWVDEVMFCIPPEMNFPMDILDKCNTMGVVTHVAVNHKTKTGLMQSVSDIEGYTVVSSSIHFASANQLFYKRVMDIVGSICGLFITAILVIVIGPIIYIKSPGPIFFAQTRIGKNGRQFKIYKFRSMYMDAEERKKELMDQNNIKDGMMFKMDDDPRIIKGIGNFIREHSLDEFPQFWNVFKGDMSIVGTRPPTLDEWEKYDYHHRKRMTTKPGITGVWQTSGRSNIVDFEEVVEMDTNYIQDWNIGKDIKIILKTVMVVFSKEGSK